MIALPDILNAEFSTKRGWSLACPRDATLAEQFELLDWPNSLGDRPTLAEIEAAAATVEAAAARRSAAQAAIAAGYLVEPEGFRLRLTQEASDLFGKLRGQVLEGLSLGVLTAESPVQIIDQSDALQTLTVQRLREVLFAYGQRFTQLWFAAR